MVFDPLNNHISPPGPSEEYLFASLGPLIGQMILHYAADEDQAENYDQLVLLVRQKIQDLKKLHHPLIEVTKNLLEHLFENKPWVQGIRTIEKVGPYFVQNQFKKDYQFLLGLSTLHEDLTNDPHHQASPLHQFLFWTGEKGRLRTFATEILSFLQNFLSLFSPEEISKADVKIQVEENLRDENVEGEFATDDVSDSVHFLLLTALANILRKPSLDYQYCDHLKDFKKIDVWLKTYSLIHSFLPPDSLNRVFSLMIKRIFRQRFSQGLEGESWKEDFPYIAWSIWGFNPLISPSPENFAKKILDFPIFSHAELWISFLQQSMNHATMNFGDRLQVKILLLKLTVHQAKTLPKLFWGLRKKILERFYQQMDETFNYVEAAKNTDECKSESVLDKIELRLIRYYSETLLQIDPLLPDHWKQSYIYWEKRPDDFLLNFCLYLATLSSPDYEMTVLQQKLKKHFNKEKNWEGFHPQYFSKFLWLLETKTPHHKLLKKTFFDPLDEVNKLKVFNEFSIFYFLWPANLTRFNLPFLLTFYKVFLEEKEIHQKNLPFLQTYHFHRAFYCYLSKKELTEIDPKILKQIVELSSELEKETHNSEVREILQKFQYSLLQGVCGENKRFGDLLRTSTGILPPDFLLPFLQGLSGKITGKLEEKILVSIKNFFERYLLSLENLSNEELKKEKNELWEEIFSCLNFMFPSTHARNIIIQEMKGTLILYQVNGMGQKKLKMNFKRDDQLNLWT